MDGGVGFLEKGRARGGWKGRVRMWDEESGREQRRKGGLCFGGRAKEDKRGRGEEGVVEKGLEVGSGEDCRGLRETFERETWRKGRKESVREGFGGHSVDSKGNRLRRIEGSRRESAR